MRKQGLRIIQGKIKGCFDVFRKRRGIHIPYNKQGLIYFICLNVKDMPIDIQQRISSLCSDIGGQYSQALYAMLTDSNESVRSISVKFHISETQLYFYRKKFYEKWENP